MPVSVRSYEEALLLFKFFVGHYMNGRQTLTSKNETAIKM